MKILYIGRFQPFHNGHLELIKYIKDKYKEIIIGIGSAQYKNDFNNPFSFNERKIMIEKSLIEIKINNFVIVKIPDIHNYSKWVSHVESLVPKFDHVVTNSELNAKLFKDKGYKIVQTPIYDRKNFSGKNIRQTIFLDKKWEKLIPKQVSQVIKEIDGVKRIKDSYK